MSKVIGCDELGEIYEDDDFMSNPADRQIAEKLMDLEIARRLRTIDR